MENNNLDSAEKMRLTTEFFFEADPNAAVSESFGRRFGSEILRATLFVRDGINKAAEINSAESFDFLLQKAQKEFAQNTRVNLGVKEILERLLRSNNLDYPENVNEVVTAPMNIVETTGKTVGEVLDETKSSETVEAPETVSLRIEKSPRERKLIAQAEEIMDIIKIAKKPNIKLKAIKQLRELANETFENNFQLNSDNFASVEKCMEILARIETASRFYIGEKGKNIQRVPAGVPQQSTGVITGEMNLWKQKDQSAR
jgi:hypothetical protein